MARALPRGRPTITFKRTASSRQRLDYPRPTTTHRRTTTTAPEDRSRGCRHSASRAAQEQRRFEQVIGFDVVLVPPLPVAVSVTV